MLEQRVLIAEDDVSTAVMLSEFITSRGYVVDTAGDGAEALEKFSRNPFHIVITDIEMPIMDGNELIERLNGLESPPIIFVTTSSTSPELIIDIMKKGVYDYIIKPVDMSDLLMKLSRAAEAYELKHAQDVAQREKVIRIESNLEWYKIQEKLHYKDIQSLGSNIFENLLVSLTQGGGIGNLISMLTFMQSCATRQDGFYHIPEQLFDLIMANVKMAERAMQTFVDMNALISQPVEAERLTLSRIHAVLKEEIRAMREKVLVRNNLLLLSDAKPFFDELEVEVNLDYLIRAFREMAVNGLKFSPAGAPVIVVLQRLGEAMTLSVINDAVESDKKIVGVPLGYENLVFEPFYRLSKTVQEEYGTLEYGLGLTLAERIAAKFGGRISIGNVTDYTDISAGAKTKVACSLSFDFAESAAR